GVDDLQYTYTGIFFGSVLLLGWLIIGLGLATLLDRGRAWHAATLTGGLAVGVWAALAGSFTNSYSGEPELPALANVIAADPRWETGPPILTLDQQAWPETAGLLIQLERRGRRPWVLHPYYDVIFTDGFRLDGRALASPLWQIDVA